MAKLPASLFNDVIGPVMRGPSSSHVAGAARIGALSASPSAGMSAASSSNSTSTARWPNPTTGTARTSDSSAGSSTST